MKYRYWSILLLVSSFVFLASGIFYIFFSNTPFDEGNYVYKGYLFITRQDVNYIKGSIWSEYMPGSYFLAGVTQLLFGKSFYLARFASFLFGVLTIIISYKLLNRFFGRLEAILSVFLIAVNSTLVQSFSIAIPYSLSAFFLITSIYVSILSNKISNKIIFFSLFLMFMSVFVRASMLPNYLIFVLIMLVKHKYKRKIILFSSFIIPIILLWPFAPEVLRIFINFPIISSVATYFGYPNVYFSYFSQGINFSKIIVSFLEFFKYYQIWLIPLISCVFLLGLLIADVKYRAKVIKLFTKNNSILAISGMLFLINILSHFVGAYGHCPRCVIPYFNYYSVLGAVVLSILLGFIINNSKEYLLPKAVSILCLLIVLFVGAGTLANLINHQLANTPVRQIERISNNIKRDAVLDGYVFSLVDPHYLYLSGKKGFGPLINKEYGLRDSENLPILEKSGLWNLDMAKSWIEKDSAYVLISDSTEANFNSVKKGIGTNLIEEINKYFKVYKVYDNSLTGKILLYERKND